MLTPEEMRDRAAATQRAAYRTVDNRLREMLLATAKRWSDAAAEEEIRLVRAGQPIARLQLVPSGAPELKAS